VSDGTVLAIRSGLSGDVVRAAAAPPGSRANVHPNHAHGQDVVNTSFFNGVPYKPQPAQVQCVSLSKKSGVRCGSLVTHGDRCFYHREGGPVGLLERVDSTVED